MRTRFLVWFAVIGLVACGNGDDKLDDTGPGETTPTPTNVGGISNVVATPSEVIPTVVTVTWDSDLEGTALVEYGLDGALDLSTPASMTSAMSHSATLLGLKASGVYSYRAVTVTADGERLEGATGSMTIAPPDQGLPNMSLVSLDAAKANGGGDGYVLMSFIGTDATWVAIVDRDGDYVWWYPDPGEALSIGRAKMGRDGDSVLFNYADAATRIEDLGGITRVSLDGTQVTETRTLMAHHDFVELPDGNFAWPAFDLQKSVNVDGLGDVPLASEYIYEGPEGAGESDLPTEVYRYLDDYVEPFWTCSHMALDGFVPGYHEWIHINSLTYVDSEDSYYTMSRWMDSLQKIDRATGSQVWQIGGANGTMTLPGGANPWRDVGDTDLWSHGHMSHMWADGMLIFDNGDHRTEEVSRVVEYAVDEVAGTVEEVWEFVHPEGQFSLLLGDARRLDNGNTLVSWSGFGTVQEVTSSGDTAWQVQTGVGTVVSRVQWIDDLY